MQFWKYQGTGNDFVILKNLGLQIKHSEQTAIELCDRHFGIGSDGLIIIETSDEADFKMVFYNPDGSKSFCGNGSRCAVKFAFDEGIISNKLTSFVSTDGKHHAEILPEMVELGMHNPVFLPLEFEYNEIPILACSLINTGSPHLVIFLEGKINLTAEQVRIHGAKIRYSEQFVKEGVNVNFIAIQDLNNINIRTYERGVEDETLSCGTGVTASAIAYHSLFNKAEGNICIDVMAQGGQLKVKFDYLNQYSKTLLCGPAVKVFSGEI